MEICDLRKYFISKESDYHSLVIAADFAVVPTDYMLDAWIKALRKENMEAEIQGMYSRSLHHRGQHESSLLPQSLPHPLYYKMSVNNIRSEERPFESQDNLMEELIHAVRRFVRYQIEKIQEK